MADPNFALREGELLAQDAERRAKSFDMSSTLGALGEGVQNFTTAKKQQQEEAALNKLISGGSGMLERQLVDNGMNPEQAKTFSAIFSKKGVDGLMQGYGYVQNLKAMNAKKRAGQDQARFVEMLRGRAGEGRDEKILDEAGTVTGSKFAHTFKTLGDLSKAMSPEDFSRLASMDQKQLDQILRLSGRDDLVGQKLDAVERAKIAKAEDELAKLDAKQKANIVDRKVYERVLKDTGYFKNQQNLNEKIVAVNNLASSLEMEKGVGDIASIFQFMKALDPQSVVREGEFQVVADAGGLLQGLLQKADQMITGGGFLPHEVKDALFKSSIQVAANYRKAVEAQVQATISQLETEGETKKAQEMREDFQKHLNQIIQAENAIRKGININRQNAGEEVVETLSDKAKSTIEELKKQIAKLRGMNLGGDNNTPPPPPPKKETNPPNIPNAIGEGGVDKEIDDLSL